MNDHINSVICKSMDKFGFGTQRICASLRLPDDSKNQYLHAIWFCEQPDRIFLLPEDTDMIDWFLAAEYLVEMCLHLYAIKGYYGSEEFDGVILLSNNKDKADICDEIRALTRKIYSTVLEKNLYYEFEDYWQWVEEWAGDTDCEEPIEHNGDAWIGYEEYVEYVDMDGDKLELYEMGMLILGKETYLGYIKDQRFPNEKLCYVSFSKVLAGIIEKHGKDDSVVDYNTVKNEIFRSVTEIKRERDIRSSKYCYYYDELLSVC